MTSALLAVADITARRRLEAYIACLRKWAPRINLTAREDEASLFRTLVAPVLGAETLLRGRVLDVGSGNGSPGLVLSALRPDLSFLLLEPRAKRWAFLREAAREMDATNVEVRRARSNEIEGTKADSILMRAVGLDPRELTTLLAPGGCVLVFGGPDLTGAERIELPSGAHVQRLCFT